MADLISSLTLTTLRFVLRHLPDVPIRDIDDPCLTTSKSRLWFRYTSNMCRPRSEGRLLLRGRKEVAQMQQRERYFMIFTFRRPPVRMILGEEPVLPADDLLADFVSLAMLISHSEEAIETFIAHLR
jgi:hypothetical protein